jgi:coiled-coil domain-containing protein 55
MRERYGCYNDLNFPPFKKKKWLIHFYFALIANLDVTKQRDLSGFYRHLYKQTFSEDQPKKVEEPEEPVTFKKEAVESEVKSRRQYRSRREEEEVEEEEESSSPEPGTEQIEPEIPGDISNAEGGKSRSNEEHRPAASASLVSAAATDRAATADRAAKKTAASDVTEKPTTSSRRPDIKEEEEDSESDDDEKRSSHSPPPEEVAPPPKVKIDIWKKRTTGQLLEEAIQRYLARKEAREIH